MESIFIILLFIGAAQGLLLSTALFSMKKGNTAANKILAVLLFSFSVLIFFFAAGHYHGQPSDHGKHRWLIHGFLFIIAPLLFLYTKAMTEFRSKMQWKESFHFLPSFIAVIVALLLENIIRLEVFTPIIDWIFLALLAVQMIAYLIRMLFILHEHSKNIQNTFSSLEKINLRWLRIFVISQTIIWPVAGFIDVHIHDFSEIGFVWLLVSIFMYITGYFGIRQPEIFSGELQESRVTSQERKKKYEKSAISPEQAELILQRLQTLMQSSKPYLIPTLTLNALSKQLNVSPHHLSQIFNERLNKNFYEFINQYRVKEAKILLKDPQKQHLTLAAIGFEAGFNSVSSFNNIFKKVTSFTPSEYRLSNDTPRSDSTL